MSPYGVSWPQWVNANVCGSFKYCSCIFMERQLVHSVFSPKDQICTHRVILMELVGIPLWFKKQPQCNSIDCRSSRADSNLSSFSASVLSIIYRFIKCSLVRQLPTITLPTAPASKFWLFTHYGDVIMSAMASQITGISAVCSNVCSGADQRSHQSSLAFVRGNHVWPVDTPTKDQ